METFLQDVRYAFRTLSRSRMFALIAVACLAIGIGVNTTIFSVVNAILLRPFDFRDPDQLVVLEEQNTRNNSTSGVAWPNLVDWRTRLYRNDGGFKFTYVSQSGVAGFDGVRMQFGDLDNDGRADLAISGVPTEGGAFSRVYRNNGASANPT